MINFIKIFRRQEFISFLILISILIILYRCFSLQYIESKNYSSEIEKREIRKEIIKASRGSIVDRNNIILAESILLDTLSVTNADLFLKNDRKDIQELCVILNKNCDDLKKDIQRKRHKKQFHIKRQLSASTVKQINSLRLNGIIYEKEFQRFYPRGEEMAPLIGKTNIDHVGHMCLEKSYDSFLKGVDGERIVRKDKDGKVVENIRLVSPAKDGEKLILTIDSRLQYVAYRELKKKIEQVNAKSGSVVILDTSNGDILAAASYPSYDPNNKNAYTSEGERNRAIIDSIEPGSTIKPFLFAAAVDSGSIKLGETFDTSPGYIKFGKKIYKDFKDYGLLSSKGVIIKSSNVGSIKISQKLNKKTYHDLLEYLGIGEMVNIKFPSEISGKLKHFSEWSESDIRSHALGYALQVTPLQLAKAYSVIANDGLVINPRINLKSFVQKENKQKYKNGFIQTKNVIKQVVEEGTGKNAFIDGYTIGGKTGTAEVFDKKYNKKKHTSLFAGITFTNPKLVIVVVINEPNTKPDQFYGAYVAAPVFKTIASDSLRILNISPNIVLEKKEKVSSKTEKMDVTIFKNPEDKYVF